MLRAIFNSFSNNILEYGGWSSFRYLIISSQSVETSEGVELCRIAYLSLFTKTDTSVMIGVEVIQERYTLSI